MLQTMAAMGSGCSLPATRPGHRLPRCWRQIRATCEPKAWSRRRWPEALAGVIGLSGPYDFVISGQYREVFGPVSQWPQAQAINFIDGTEPPFLLVHGTRDRAVAARNSVQLARKLTANDVRADLLLLDDAGHSAPLLGLYDPRRSPRLLPALLDFIDATGSSHAAH